MSAPRPHGPAAARLRTRARARRAGVVVAGVVFAGASASACGEGGELSDAAHDSGFGRGVTTYPRDAGMDGGSEDGAAVDRDSLRVRFVHALVNLGPLHVCHDPDGAGPAPARPLVGEGRPLAADFRGRSAPLVVPALGGGSLTLQQTPADAGAGDAGIAVPCDEATREATIPLPVRGDWVDPRAPLDEGSLEALGLAQTLTGGGALTLIGSGLALSPAALDLRANQALERALAASPGDLAGATRAAELERRALEAAYGARLLLQRDPPATSAKHFALSVLHAAPDVGPGGDATEAVGAVRLCITAGTRESSVWPKAPEPGIPYRLRTQVGSAFDPGLEYHFRIFAERDFDAEKRDCSTISVSPLAERRVTRTELRAGHAYTLALYGALVPSAVCSPVAGSLVRPGCAHPAAELGAQLALLED